MPSASSRDPIVVIVIGVSGSGKSTVGSLLAKRLGWPFVDGDDLHTPDQIAKMRAGTPLDDADRAPWLARVASWIDARLGACENGVIVCSALKRAYRDALVRGRENVRIVDLRGSREMIAKRLAGRRGHFMPPRLLDSQLATLEEPGPDENPISVVIDDSPDDIAATIAIRLGMPEA